MRRLTCLILLGAVLAAGPGLAQVSAPPTVAVVSPPLSSAATGRDGCTPSNPCAIVTPALGNVAMPAPQEPPQPDLPASTDSAAAPAMAGNAAPPVNADCPPAGARGGFTGAGRGQFMGRGGDGTRGGFTGRGFAGRGEGRGFGGANAPAGRGTQFAQNGRGFGRAANGCPRPAGGADGRNPQ